MHLNDCEARFGAAFNRGHGELVEFHLLSQQGEETQLFLLHRISWPYPPDFQYRNPKRSADARPSGRCA